MPAHRLFSVALLPILAIACGGSVSDDPSQNPSAPPAGSWCAQQGTHDFCADFDSDTSANDWDRQKAFGRWSPVASERSAPNALEVQSGPSKMNERSKTIPFGADKNVARAEVDFQVRSFQGDGPLKPIRVSFVHDVGGSRLFHFNADVIVERDHTTFRMWNACGYAGGDPPPPCVDHGPMTHDESAVVNDLPRDRWVRIAIELDLGASRATLRYDDAVVGVLTNVSGDRATVTGVTVMLGALDAPEKDPKAIAAFDNVLLDLK